jgi:hypothetical protein
MTGSLSPPAGAHDLRHRQTMSMLKIAEFTDVPNYSDIQ